MAEKLDTSKYQPGLKDSNEGVSESDPNRTFLDKVGSWESESRNFMSTYENRWAKNIKLKLGIFTEATNTKSVVRNTEKVFFRKIWSTGWRLLAAFYNAFLRDPDSYRIEGRDSNYDWHEAGVLSEMVAYRRDKMYRTQNLFLKHIWAFQDIHDFGICVGKMRWVYDEERGIDEPQFTLYPPEQVRLDLSAETEDEMRYAIFINYMTEDDLNEAGYENVKDAKPSTMPYNQVRAARHNTYKDPMQNFGDNEYPRPGAVSEGEKDAGTAKRYIVWEIFYREKGKIMFAVTNERNCVLKKPEESAYGDRIPMVLGQCLTLAHKLIGEGFPEAQEGPQESFNYNINMRKDNVALAMNKHTIVSRYGGVDLKSLANSRAGGITLADDVNAVQDRDIRDVTGSAYAEAAADEGMMQELSGVTAGKQGMGEETKATVAQINYSESNAKIDLFVAIVAETYWKAFHSMLAYLIQRFETNDTVFRIANDRFKIKEDNPYLPNVYDMDFDADCIVNVGLGTVGREFEIKQTLLAMDRAIMANQATAALLQTGMLQPQQAKFFNLQGFMDDLLPILSKKNTSKYYIQAQPPQAQGGMDEGMAGKLAPQIGKTELTPEHDMMRMGSLGPA